MIYNEAQAVVSSKVARLLARAKYYKAERVYDYKGQLLEQPYDGSPSTYPAPTLYEAVTWLRNIKKIHIQMSLEPTTSLICGELYEGVAWQHRVHPTAFTTYNATIAQGIGSLADSYEKVLNDGIKAALKFILDIK